METNMKKAVIGLMLVVGFAGVLYAEEEASGIGVDLTVDFNSKYVWRGQNLVDDWVMQPGASTTIGGFTLGVWGNVDMTNENGEEWEFTEVDYYVDYSGDLAEGIGYSIGYIYYEFPQAGGDTQEVYAGMSFDTFLSPSVTWYYDFDAVDGSYVAFGLGHSVEVSDGLALDLGMNLGWGDSSYNSAYWGVDDDGFNDLTLSVGLPIELGSWTLTPSVNYVNLIDSDISDAADDDDIVYAGIGLSTSF